MRSLVLRLHGTMRATLLASILTLTLGSCDEGISPDGRIMVYVLQSIDGDVAPARPNAPSNHEVIADSLIFDLDGTGLERMVIRTDEDGVVRTSSMTFRWTRRGARLEVWGWCPPITIAACPGVPVLGGTTEGALWYVIDSYRYRTPAVFRRVD